MCLQKLINILHCVFKILEKKQRRGRLCVCGGGGGVGGGGWGGWGEGDGGYNYSRMCTVEKQVGESQYYEYVNKTRKFVSLPAQYKQGLHSPSLYIMRPAVL